jgi:hypothetical protein
MPRKVGMFRNPRKVGWLEIPRKVGRVKIREHPGNGIDGNRGMIGGIVGGNSPDKSRPSNYHQRHQYGFPPPCSPPTDATPTPKTHPFFFGADWNSLRHIEPPFVPHLQSTADTSYFPTEEFGNVAEQMEQVEGISLEVPEVCPLMFFFASAS